MAIPVKCSCSETLLALVSIGGTDSCSQIYFGPSTAAKAFFVSMGFYCAERATTGDFLTSLTNPAERVARDGYEHLVPQTPDEFAARWQNSEDRKRLLQDIENFEVEFPLGGKLFCGFGG